jgi:filamentous hemagglutinin family protein
MRVWRVRAAGGSRRGSAVAGGRWLLLGSSVLAGFWAASAQGAPALPSGYSVAAGSVAFQQSANQLTVTQGSESAIVNYGSFSIGQGGSVIFLQPNATSVILNRVTGSATSTIAGTLAANGIVYLVNPNGIAITRSGTVNVGGGFVASTLGISDADFLAGKRTFSGNGASAAVSNAGVVRIGRGGYAALLGGEVSNAGLIAVPLGRVALGSGEAATLDVSGDGFLQVAVPTAGGGALVSNSGSISGSTVILDAATAIAAARNAVNISGAINAQSIGGQNGAIVIGGGQGGEVAISGELSSASGSIAVTGQRIVLTGASFDASGSAGGGTIRIGGDQHGGGTLQKAQSVAIDAGTTIRADATANGDGGSVVVWSTAATDFAGLISAKAGPDGGDGGQAEVSSHGVLNYAGFTDLTAPHGSTGTLLLDPFSVTISNGAQTNESFAGGTYTPTGTSVINAATLGGQLAGANVVITTGGAGSPGTDAGDITVAAPVSWSSGSTLTLDAFHSINVDAAITVAGAGGVILTTNDGGSGGALSFPGSLAFTGTPNTGQSLVINGQSYTLLYSMSDIASLNGGSGHDALALSLTAPGTAFTSAVVASFSGTLEGLGNSLTGLTINDTNTGGVDGLIGLLTSSGLVADLRLVGASVTGAGPFVGGLIGYNEGIVQASTAANGAVSGDTIVGGLVGGNDPSGQIVSSSSSETVSTVAGGSAAGGLVGVNNGSIVSSQASGSVNVPGHSSDAIGDIGGLVGVNNGAVSGSIASGSVSGGEANGGLVGLNNGSVSNSLAQGSVVFGQWTGGLVGYNHGTVDGSASSGGTVSTIIPTILGGLVGDNDPSGQITRSLSSEPVSASGTFDAAVGGLVGLNDGSVSGSFVSGGVIAGNDGEAGGLAGRNDGTVTGSTATGAVSGGGVSGGLVGINTGLVSDSEAQGSITDANVYAGGLVGYNNGTISGATTNTGAIAISQPVDVGGLVGYNDASGQITASTSSETIVSGGAQAVGGLVGVNTGSVTGSLASGDVSAPGSADGGLAGVNNGSISGATASGTVSGGASNGGLVGHNFGGIFNSVAQGSVSGGALTGGLVGDNAGTVSASEASGGTVVSTLVEADVGGLVGLNESSGVIALSHSSPTVDVTGADAFVGGLDGSNLGLIQTSFSSGDIVSSSGGGEVGGLVGFNNGTIRNTYETGSVSTYVLDGPSVGGLVGRETGGAVSMSWASGTVAFGGGGLFGFVDGSGSPATLTDLYWDVGGTGQTNGINGQGGTILQTSVVGIGGTTGLSPTAQATYVGFDFTNTWTINPGVNPPTLRGVGP